MSLEQLTIKGIRMIAKAMQKRITSNAVKDGYLQNDPHSCAEGAELQPVSLVGV